MKNARVFYNVQSETVSFVYRCDKIEYKKDTTSLLNHHTLDRVREGEGDGDSQ